MIIFCGPLYFQSHVSVTTADPNCVSIYPQLASHTIYQLAYVSNEQLLNFNMWWFGSICKLVPCLVLVLMTLLILKQLGAIRQMSARFSNAEKDRNHTRTTHIILVIMTVFILVEFPQGILNIAQSIFEIPNKDLLWDFFELCTLATSCIIFGLFLTMNSRLREAFLETVSRNLAKLRPCCAPK